ncbi:uncharacterized protein LOC111030506 [Myzus persicae]|uniref:uncharacterized protein LOC111030506 n=1 Tax=Myzus persicae TaxID=13164 RepID=UPI000B938FD1|nr:uncharacterized protein LOC111030506 [Myzus persicae]
MCLIEVEYPHRKIKSGSPLNLWGVSTPGWTKRRASAISTIAGCPEELKQMIKCLKEVPAKFLVNVYNILFWRNYPIISVMPVAEKCNCSKESLLCDYPLLCFKQITKVLVLMGMNSRDVGIFASRMNNATHLVYTEFLEDFNHYTSSFLQYRYTVKFSDIPFIGDEINTRYFSNGKLEDPLSAIKMITGGLFLHGIFQMATKLSQSVYYYIYYYSNAFLFNSLYRPYPFPTKLGVTYADEVTSFFSTSDRSDLPGNDFNVSNCMVKIWTNFATKEYVTYTVY